MGEIGVRTLQGIIGGLFTALIVLSAAPAQSLEQVPAAPAPPSPQSSLPPLPADTCGAADLADLVGKPRSEIPVPIDPARRRVYCTTCMVTQDYDPSRLNIVFDAQTGIVKQVKCG